ncbi:MAG: cell division protein SepF [Clostridium sp.]|uniref:cell division protein SepF n=1 Tax=Clostridium sp. TaxID=1506 RepID=UPI003EE578D6
MANMVSKMKNFFGLGDEDEDIEEYGEEYGENELATEEEAYEENGPVIIGGGRRDKVVNIHNNVAAKVLITKPTSYEESMEICDALTNRRIVVINTANLENKTARRLLDFISGASYALKGDFQEIDKGVYILSPSNVEVTNELKSELTSKALFNWSK